MLKLSKKTIPYNNINKVYNNINKINTTHIAAHVAAIVRYIWTLSWTVIEINSIQGKGGK